LIHPYATPAYARSLPHVGQAFGVPEWGCEVLLREFADAFDATGTYPMAVLAADADLSAGLKRLKAHGAVSVTLVLDDFHRPSLEALRQSFNLVTRFKTHQLQRATLPFAYDKHHRYEVRRASSRVRVRAFDLAQAMPEWCALYDALVARHELQGLHRFPAEHFRALGRLPGVTSIGAWIDDRLVSAHLWVSDGRFVHSHLAASSEAGYAAGAAYAVYDASIRHFAGAEVVNFGGGAGFADDGDDGLMRFKRGFANDSAPAYLCGAILDAPRYAELARQTGVAPDTLFFPAYRARMD
jgi:hypothetical protein